MNFGKLNYERISLIALSALISLIWSGLILAGFGHFSVLLAGAVAALSAIGMVAWLRRSLKSGGEKDTFSSTILRYDIAALLIAMSSLIITLPAGEFILGGWDPGVYLHTAVQLDQNESLQFEHPDIIQVPLEDRGILYRNLNGIAEPFGGMRLLPNRRVTPQFYHAYPTLLAFAHKLGGLRAMLLVNPLLNVIALLAFYVLVAGWTGRQSWGLAGVFILAINPTQIWQAQFCTAEMLTQTLMLVGLAALLHWSRKPETRLPQALLGGTALGLALLTRYDTLIFLTLFVPLLLWNTVDRRHRKGLVVFLSVLAIAILHVWIHQRWVAPFYKPLGSLVQKMLWVIVILTAFALAFRNSPVGKKVVRAGKRPTLLLISAAWLGWMFFNWMIRPTLYQRTHLSAAIRDVFASVHLDHLASILIGPNSRCMLYMETIFGPVALAVALCAVLILLWRAKTPAEHAWAWSGLGVTLLLTWQPYNDLFMMWVSRRYIPVVIPWVTLGLIAGCIALDDFVRNRLPRLRSVSTGIFVFCLSVFFMQSSSQQMAMKHEWPGLIDWFENVQSQIPDDKQVYTDQPGFAAPLRFIWQKKAFEAHHLDVSRREQFRKLIERAAQRNGSVYVLTRNPPPEGGMVWKLVADVPLTSEKLIQTRHRIPNRMQDRGGPFALYVIEAPESP